MQAVILHKYFLLKVSELSKSWLYNFNSALLNSTGSEDFSLTAVPVFPLWIFTSLSKDSADEILFLKLYTPAFNQKEIYFPVEIFYGSSQSPLTQMEKLVFGKFICNSSDGVSEEEISAGLKKIKAPYSLEEQNAFPLVPAVFKTGEVKAEHNQFLLFDEKWHKAVL